MQFSTKSFYELSCDLKFQLPNQPGDKKTYLLNFQSKIYHFSIPP